MAELGEICEAARRRRDEWARARPKRRFVALRGRAGALLWGFRSSRGPATHDHPSSLFGGGLRTNGLITQAGLTRVQAED